MFLREMLHALFYRVGGFWTNSLKDYFGADNFGENY